MRGAGREDIAAVKRAAHGWEEIPFSRYLPGVRRVAGENHRGDAVVRSDKILTRRFDKNRPAGGPDARVHYNYVHRLFWKRGMRLGDYEGSLGDFEGRRLVADVDDGDLWTNAENHPFHRPNE